ncbi:hypothetical protein P154DRAFT_583573 [Amniculicola lignicola CBS 123094]|uniref:HTH APSES-type domain-containing protein n=1 Tax=Amniculicola lignicola CBS 123094 TaxID=1392246 RepID=A0A6A5W0I7_9PLEO|nr:hypothetical protein P154DRAFT_583573 [Amniculicola lignicola CBS 123094]
MVSKRVLPDKRNSLIEPDNSPTYESLVERRRLGQTHLALKPGVVGISSASKVENAGNFDYAHLRVPLPKDLSGSGIFTLTKTTQYPESYFLMRRSSDGYISATGMFKAAFPWASLAEEEAERKFQKTFPSAGPEEIAGSVWIAPDEALQLSDEYGMRLWIESLLDPAAIEKGTKDKYNLHISMPPKYEINTVQPTSAVPPTLRPTRARSSRSVSPSKIATPARKIATPRKRTTRSTPKPESQHAEEVMEPRTTRASSALHSVMNNGIAPVEAVAAPELVNGEVKPADTIHIEVQETVETNGDIETTTTNVKIDVPADHPELSTPEDPTETLVQAHKIVEEVTKLEGSSSRSGKGKRKAEEISQDAEAEAEAEVVEARPAKVAKTAYTTEQKLTKEKVTRRALVGLGVMAAIGATFQYFV